VVAGNGTTTWALRGARILVTGASRGLGAALAVGLAEQGATLALVARDATRLAAVAEPLGATTYPADLAGPAVDELIPRVVRDGPIDVLVNNAGLDLTGALVDLDAARLRELIAVNLVAPMLLSRAVIPVMLAQHRGHILNVSSIAGTNALPGLAAYSASKAGLSHFTASLRAELKGTPITTTLAEIGPVDGTMMASLRGYEPTRRALARLATLQLSVDLTPEAVVQALVDAIARRRRHVRLPRRNAMFPWAAEAPRAVTEWLLTGVDAR